MNLGNDFIKFSESDNGIVFDGGNKTLTCKSSPFHSLNINNVIKNVKVKFVDNINSHYVDYVSNKGSTFSNMLLRHGSVGILNNNIVSSELLGTLGVNLGPGYETSVVDGVLIGNGNLSFGKLSYVSGNDSSRSLTLLVDKGSKSSARIKLLPSGLLFSNPLTLEYQYNSPYPSKVLPQLNGVTLKLKSSLSNLGKSGYYYDSVSGLLTFSLIHFSVLSLYDESKLSKLNYFKCGTRIRTSKGMVLIENLRSGVKLLDGSYVTSVDMFVGKLKCKSVGSKKLLMSRSIKTEKNVNKVIKNGVYYILSTNTLKSKIYANGLKCVIKN